MKALKELLTAAGWVVFVIALHALPIAAIAFAGWLEHQHQARVLAKALAP